MYEHFEYLIFSVTFCSKYDETFFFNYMASGAFHSSGILNTWKHNVLEAGSVSVLRWEEGDVTVLVPVERAKVNH
jgi:hypothetical protein